MPQKSAPSDPTMPQPLTPRPPLRRAVYVHVSDLTSAYNIDHKRLQLELARVRVFEYSGSSASAQSSQIPVDEASESSLPQKRLQPPRGGFNLCVLVGKVNVVVDKLRVDRSRVRLAEVEVGDETGTVSLRARDDQIDVLEELSQKSGAVVLRNCMLELFQGRHIRLAVTKWGKMSVFPDNIPSTPPAPSKINKERNFSLIDLSVVASEMVENQPPEVGYTGSNRESPTDRNRGPQNRQPFQPPQYQAQPQAQLQQRRTTRDRRQPRPGRGVGAKNIPIPFPEISMQSQMRYPGVPGYAYGESLELQHYAYGAPRSNQEGMQPTPHQFMQLQQQQYEMQRMQQMQAFHEQGDRNRRLLHQMQPNRGAGQKVASSNSFDLGAPDFPSLPRIVPMHSGNQPQEEGSSNTSGKSQHEGTEISRTGPEMGPWGRQHHLDPGMDDSVRNSPMNPSANVFAPSYDNRAGGPTMQPMHYHQGFHPVYDQMGPYSQQQHTVYAHNVVYVPVPRGNSDLGVAPGGQQPANQSEEVKPSTSTESPH